jgi:hypothetical protein
MAGVMLEVAAGNESGDRSGKKESLQPVSKERVTSTVPLHSCFTRQVSTFQSLRTSPACTSESE